MKFTKKRMSIILFVLVGVFYLCSPYYSAWQMIKAIESGSSEKMQKYIDFPKVQASIKQQIDTSIEQQSDKDPMSMMVVKMFQPMVNQLVDELLKPEKLAELIKHGKLNKNSRKATKVTKPSLENKTVSWFAFFDRPNRFRISSDNSVLYMELQDWQWKMIAIGTDGLLNMNRPSQKVNQKFVEDKIETSPSIPLVAVTDIEAIKKDISQAFIIEYDHGHTAKIVGEFYYVPSMSVIKPIVTWIDAYDSEGNNILGEFSQRKKEDREKYNTANNYYKGKWTDELPKSTSKKVITATGLCKVEVPTKVEKFILNDSNLNKMQAGSISAVTLMGMSNGNIDLSYYTPFNALKVEPVIIVKNKLGQPLRQPSAFSSTRGEAITNKRFKEPMRGTTKNITISGTPHTIEIYFPLEFKKIETKFTATGKPVISFGELESEIRQTRYTEPAIEPKLKEVTKDYVLNDMKISFREKTEYDKSIKRYLSVKLPKVYNSLFADVDFKGVSVFLNGKKLRVRYNRESSRYSYSSYFAEYTKDWSGKILSIDKAQGSIKIRYPAKLENIIINQGEERFGIKLEGPNVTYPEGDVPSYTSVYDSPSVIAYGENDKQIALLNNGSFWYKKGNKIIFWGSPDYVKVKRVTKWIELDIPVNFSLSDLEVDKKQTWGLGGR